MNSLKIFIFLVNILLAYSAKNKFDDCKFKWGRNWYIIIYILKILIFKMRNNF
jgi:hypothetical protein